MRMIYQALRTILILLETQNLNLNPDLKIQPTANQLKIHGTNNTITNQIKLDKIKSYLYRDLFQEIVTPYDSIHLVDDFIYSRFIIMSVLVSAGIVNSGAVEPHLLTTLLRVHGNCCIMLLVWRLRLVRFGFFVDFFWFSCVVPFEQMFERFCSDNFFFAI